MAKSNGNGKRSAKSSRNAKGPAKKKAGYRRPTPPKVKNPLEVFKKLAAEQGVDLENQFEKILGSGKDLWASDEECERFVAYIYEQRRRGRGT